MPVQTMPETAPPAAINAPTQTPYSSADALCLPLTEGERWRITCAQAAGVDVERLVRGVLAALPDTMPHATNTPAARNGANGHAAVTNGSPAPLVEPIESDWDRMVQQRIEDFERSTPEQREAADREMQDLLDTLEATKPLTESVWQRHMREAQEAFETMTPQELDAADAEWDDFAAAINAERDHAGARRVF